MKTFKPFELYLIILLVISSHNVFGQYNALKPDAKKDSAWIKQSIATYAPDTIIRDTDKSVEQWTNGKIIYSDDGSLKAMQLTTSDSFFLTTAVQYIYHDKKIERRIDSTDLSSYSLDKIYRLPDKAPSYLFLLSKIDDTVNYIENDWLRYFYKTERLPNDTDFNHIKHVTYVAVMFRLEKDVLVEVAIPPYADTGDDEQNHSDADTTNYGDKKSFGFISYISQVKNFPRPYLKYDSLAHTLNFMDVSCKEETDYKHDCTSPCLNIEMGKYQYKDTAFILTSDTSYYYPSLNALTKVVAHHNYRAGKYIIKAKAIEGYEEDYGAAIIPTLTEEYKIGSQTLTDFNNGEWGKIDLTPDYRLQKKSSLILVLDDEVQGYSPGECGAAASSDFTFWLVNSKSKKQLFTYSYGSCHNAVSYTYKQNGKEVSGNLYVSNPSEEGQNEIENCYWKNNSTYVLVIGDVNEENEFRNFYLHFNVSDKKNQVTLTSGKIYTKRIKAK